MTPEENTINAEMTVHALISAIDAMHSMFNDLNTRDIIMNDFDFLDVAQDKLALLVAKIRVAQERREAKVHQYEFSVAAE